MLKIRPGRDQGGLEVAEYLIGLQLDIVTPDQRAVFVGGGAP